MDALILNQQLQTIARKAGDYIKNTTDRHATQKTDPKDFVTVADIKSQNIIERELRAALPGCTVVSEEHPPAHQKQMESPDFTGFVIDPIDGTYNFKRDMKESGISIGYIQNGQPATGVIYDPYKDEMYSATKGTGAFCNGQPIRVSDENDLSCASVATSNSYDSAALARNLRRHLAIYEHTGTAPWTSCPGSAVLIIAYMARGRFDAYHHNSLKPWDNAAAFLLLREAGGVVLDLHGNEATYLSPTIIAGTPKIVNQLKVIFSNIDPDLLA